MTKQTQRWWTAMALAIGGTFALVAALITINGDSEAASTAGGWRSPTRDAQYSKHWHDGKAELAGYDLQYPRYGKVRQGTAVMITVTEPFRDEPRVKADRSGGKRFPVLKLNLVQDFPTGVYDYNMMTSAFVAMDNVNGLPAGSLTKLSFSSQEWCGHVYEQAVFDSSGVRRTMHSYFENEADQQERQKHAKGGFAEDALWLWARGLAGPSLEAGESITIPLYRSMAYRRLLHTDVAWDTAALTRAVKSERVTVPAGTFDAVVMTAKVTPNAGDGASPFARAAQPREWTFYVDPAYPHRIVRWTRSDGIDAKLIKADRLPYWALNRPGGEAELKRLGLAPRAPRMP